MPDATIVTAKRSPRCHAPEEAAIVAFRAIAWIVANSARGERFLALTGLSAGDLRARIDDRAVQAAALGFLAGHEADLIACAGELGIAPEEFALAAATLAR